MFTLTNKFSWQPSLIWFCGLLLMMAVVGAPRVAVGAEACQSAMLEAAFRDYVQSVDQSQVETIQQQLNDGGYGPVNVDGVLGSGTRLALQKVCQEFAVPESDDIADVVIRWLEINASVIQTAPQWRQTIASEPFKAWLAAQSMEEQTKASQTMASGPAESIIALLNRFSPVATSSDSTKKDVTTSTLPPCAKQPALPPIDEVSVYYLWQGEKKAEEGGAPDKNPAECIAAEVKINPDVVAGLELIKGVTYPNRRLFLAAVANTFADTKIDYHPDQLQLLIASRHEPLLPPAPIQIKGNGCGCSRDFASMVYGFYPSWMAQRDQDQQIDFSLFDRIGFYALTLDKNGAIANPLQWGDDFGSATLINTAHKYRVAVDLTLNASAWRDWNDAIIRNAVNSTMASTMQKLNDHSAPLSTYLPAMIKNGSSPQADGITLYFDDYTASTAGRENIIKFVTQLSKRFQATGRTVGLNIMLGLDTNAMEGQSDVFKDLATILLESAEGPAKVDHVLVFLDEPTSKAKKRIRRKIEDEFRGAERKAVLRKIIPIISPAGHERDPRGAFSQFTDDLIYLQDNFAGVGFWPLPLSADQGAATISEKLVTLYTSTTPSNRFGTMVSNFAPQLCQFACPNRWLFRIAFDLLAGILLIYGLVSIWYSAPRELFKKYLIYFVALIIATFAIAFISLVCDPFWQTRADLVLVGTIIAGIAYGVWRYVGRATQLPLP